MATDPGYAKYVCDQLRAAGGISARPMFGEYGLYRLGKIVGLIADNQLFVKPTAAGEAVLGAPTWGPPFPGAKPFLNVSDLLDDPDTLVRLIEATDAALPAPKQKPEKKAKPALKQKPALRQKPVKKTPVKKTPVKKTPVKKTPVKKTPVKKKPVKKSRR